MIDSDRGVKLPAIVHKEVGEVADELAKYCVDNPVENPLIFGGRYIDSFIPSFLISFYIYT